MAERVVKFSEWLTRTSKWLTHQFERVHRMTEWVIKVFEWLTRTDEPLTYPFKRLIKISKRVPQTLHQENPSTLESFFKSKMHSAHVNNFMQMLAEIWPTSNLNTRWSVVWQDHVTDDTRLFQLLESLSYLGRFNTNIYRTLKMSDVELFLFILKLPSTLNQRMVCQNNDIPSPARARLQESNVLFIMHSISLHCWFVRLHAKRPTNVCYAYMRNAWNALFTYGFDSCLINLEIDCQIVWTYY